MRTVCMYNMFYCFRMKENKSLLQKRLMALTEQQLNLDKDLTQRIAYNRSLDREMNGLKPELTNIQKKQDRIQL